MIKSHNLNHWAFIGTLLLALSGAAFGQPQTQRASVRSPQTAQPTQSTQPSTIDVQPQPSRMDRPLRLSVAVDDPSFLKIKEGDEVREGDIITDNKLERDRLTKQRTSLELRMKNLKDQPIHQPFEPKKPVPSKPLPPAMFSEEEAAISMAQLRWVQAQSVLEARTKLLKSENPERRSEVEKAKVALQGAEEKVHEQEELIKSMKDMKLQDQILQHESVKMAQLTNDQKQLSSEVERAEAKLDASVTEQQQQLQQLQIAVRIAKSELEVAKSRLTASQSRRKILEYNASIEQTKRSQQENQTHLQYSLQQQQYDAAVRQRDYQLAQMSISLSAIDDKLSQIPLVRSPRNGYVKRIKPWVGNDGKYTTTITIISLTRASSFSRAINTPHAAGDNVAHSTTITTTAIDHNW